MNAGIDIFNAHPFLFMLFDFKYTRGIQVDPNARLKITSNFTQISSCSSSVDSSLRSIEISCKGDNTLTFGGAEKNC